MKKIISWGSPKSVQRNNESTKWISKVKKNCKVTKGEHDFNIYKVTQCRWMLKKTFLVEYRCKCGKKKIEVKKETE